MCITKRNKFLQNCFGLKILLVCTLLQACTHFYACYENYLFTFELSTCLKSKGKKKRFSQDDYLGKEHESIWVLQQPCWKSTFSKHVGELLRVCEWTLDNRLQTSHNWLHGNEKDTLCCTPDFCPDLLITLGNYATKYGCPKYALCFLMYFLPLY